MQQNKKTNVKFKDGNNNLYDIKIEITHRNGYPEFSMSGEGNASMGQCDEHIKPKNPKQERRLELWDTYHLNGMNAGTPKQTAKIEEMKKTTSYEYDKACDYLNSFDKDGKPITAFELREIEDERIDLKERIKKLKDEIEILEEENKLQECKNGGGFIQIQSLKITQHYNTPLQFKNFFNKELLIRNKKLEDLKKILEQAQEKTLLYDRDKEGKLYKYGATWHKVDLPKNLWEEVEQLVKDIEEIEELTKTKGGDWENLHDYKKVALGKYLELEPNEAEEDITTNDDEIFNYCGTYYFVLTEDEALDKSEDYLGDEMWQMAVESGNTEMGKKEWIEYVIDKDGFGATLNTYDGTEYFDDDNKVYIMRV